MKFSELTGTGNGTGSITVAAGTTAREGLTPYHGTFCSEEPGQVANLPGDSNVKDSSERAPRRHANSGLFSFVGLLAQGKTLDTSNQGMRADFRSIDPKNDDPPF